MYPGYTHLSYPDDSWSARFKRVLRGLQLIVTAAAAGGVVGGSIAVSVIGLHGGAPRGETVAAKPRPVTAVARTSVAGPRIAPKALPSTVPAAPPAAAVPQAAPPRVVSPTPNLDQQVGVSANEPAASKPIEKGLDATADAPTLADHALHRRRALRRPWGHTDRRAIAENAPVSTLPPAARTRRRSFSHSGRAYEESRRSGYVDAWRGSDDWGRSNYGGGPYWRPGGWGGGGWGN